MMQKVKTFKSLNKRSPDRKMNKSCCGFLLFSTINRRTPMAIHNSTLVILIIILKFTLDL